MAQLIASIPLLIAEAAPFIAEAGPFLQGAVSNIGRIAGAINTIAGAADILNKNFGAGDNDTAPQDIADRDGPVPTRGNGKSTGMLFSTEGVLNPDNYFAKESGGKKRSFDEMTMKAPINSTLNAFTADTDVPRIYGAPVSEPQQLARTMLDYVHPNHDANSNTLVGAVSRIEGLASSDGVGEIFKKGASHIEQKLAAVHSGSGSETLAKNYRDEKVKVKDHTVLDWSNDKATSGPFSFTQGYSDAQAQTDADNKAKKIAAYKDKYGDDAVFEDHVGYA